MTVSEHDINFLKDQSIRAPHIDGHVPLCDRGLTKYEYITIEMAKALISRGQRVSIVYDAQELANKLCEHFAERQSKG